MAYTFDELFDNAPEGELGPAEQWFARAVITRIQEDGRVSYTEAWLALVHGNRTLEVGFGSDPGHDALEIFNDRELFRGKADGLALRISAASPTSCQVERRLESWGGAQEGFEVWLPGDPGAEGKFYAGRGVTIARGRGQALWAMAFPALEKREVPLA